jgi:hypothetical protein
MTTANPQSRRHRWPPALLALALTWLPAEMAQAAPTGRFGDAGVFSPSGQIWLSQSAASSAPSTMLVVTPLLLYFVTDGLAVGGGVGGTYSRFASGGATTTLHLAPSLGYNLWLGDRVSLFPTVLVVFSSQRAPQLAASSSVALSVEAPVLVHVGNFFVGAGPTYRATLQPRSAASGSAEIGLTTVTGGWF